MAAQKNSELMDRIAKAEGPPSRRRHRCRLTLSVPSAADLQNVIQSRSDVPHEDQHAKERWRHELEARTVRPPALGLLAEFESAAQSDLDHTGGFATTTELWNKGDANPASTPSKSDVEVCCAHCLPPPLRRAVRASQMFAEAVMGQLPAGDQYADSLEGCLAGTPYGEFARWHSCSDSYNPNQVPIQQRAA